MTVLLSWLSQELSGSTQELSGSTQELSGSTQELSGSLNKLMASILIKRSFRSLGKGAKKKLFCEPAVHFGLTPPPLPS